MTSFKNYVRKILETEIEKRLENQDYILRTEFCSEICRKYGSLSLSTIHVTLDEIATEMKLIKRHLNSQLKDFYELEIKGCPIIYISN